MAGSVIQFPSRRPVVFVDPCDESGGCWGIYSQRLGHAPTLVATRFALHDAETAAREIAGQLGAEYLNDAQAEPPGAA